MSIVQLIGYMETTSDILIESARRLERGERFAMVTIINATGSTPRKTGSRMLVDIKGNIVGSVGGAAVERMAIERSLSCLQSGESYRLELDLNDMEHLQTGMVCGGVVELLIEPMGVGARLLLFGAGHVALATARLVSEVGFAVTVYDERSEFASSERFPKAVLKVGKTDELAKLCETTEDDYLMVMTYCHDEDYRVLRQLLRKPYKYLGVIGSKRKAIEIRKQLFAEGISDDKIARMTCPIGLEIGSHTPTEIAVSVAAQLVKVRNKS